MQKKLQEKWLKNQVSIPLKSGRFVIANDVPTSDDGLCFNPLKIGSVCNLTLLKAMLDNKSFNPLKIGSVCNPYIITHK